jgi:hypothetical protein
VVSGNVPVDIVSGNSLASDFPTEHAGVAVGFENDLLTAELGIASEYDWKDSFTTTTTGGATDDPETPFDESTAGTTTNDYGTEDANVDNTYVMSAMVETTPIDALTVNLKSHMTFGNMKGEQDSTNLAVVNPNAGNVIVDEDGDKTSGQPGSLGNPAALGLSAAYDVSMMGDLVLTPEVGVDLVFQENAAADLLTDYQVGGGVFLSWAAMGLDEEDADYLTLEDQETTSGVGLGASYKSDHLTYRDGTDFATTRDNMIATKLGLYEDDGDDGYLPLVGGAAVVNFNQVLANDDIGSDGREAYSQFGLGLEANVELGVAKPFVGLITGTTKLQEADLNGDGDTNDTVNGVPEAAVDPGFTMNVGTDITVIPNTTFTVEYKSGDLTTDDNNVTDYDPNDYTISAGVDTGGGSKLGELMVSTTIEY